MQIFKILIACLHKLVWIGLELVEATLSSLSYLPSLETFDHIFAFPWDKWSYIESPLKYMKIYHLLTKLTVHPSHDQVLSSAHRLTNHLLHKPCSLSLVTVSLADWPEGTGTGRTCWPCWTLCPESRWCSAAVRSVRPRRPSTCIWVRPSLA